MSKQTNEEKNKQTQPKQSQKDRKVVVRIKERLEWMKMGRQRNGDRNWDTWDRLYQNTPLEEPQEDWQANIFVPFVMSTILAILAEITSRRTRWKVLPVSKNDDDKTDTIEAITEFTLEKGNWDKESFKRDIDKLDYGTSIWKEYYREDRRTIRKRIIKKDGKEEIEEKDIKEYNDVHGKHVPIRHFYLDDRATEIESARDCIERTVMNLSDFKAQYSKYKISKKVKEWGFNRPTISERKIQNLPEGGDLNEEGSFIPKTRLKQNQVEVLEYWNKPNDEHIVIANDIVIVNEPIPYDHKQLPYAMDICIPRPNSAYGIGIPETLYPLQEEINDIHNDILDEGKLSIHAPIITDGMTTMDEEEWKLRPGAIISTEGGNFKQVEMKGITGSHFQLLEQVQQAARVASGLDVRFSEGASQKGTETATEVMSIQEASLRRIGLLTKVLEINALPRIGRLRTANIQQFYKEPLRVQQIITDADQIRLDENTGESSLKKTNRTIRVQSEGRIGYDFKEIRPEDIRGNFDVFVVPQSTQPVSQAVILKRLNVALNTVLANEVALQVVDIEELFKHFFEQLDLPASMVSSILKEDEQVSYQLAEEENQDMATGSNIPPTKNPGLQHTSIHLAFIYEIDEEGNQSGQFSEQFQALDNDTRRIFMSHVEGEMSQQAVKGNVKTDKARTPNRAQGTGTQSVQGGAEVEAIGQGL